MTYSPSNKPLIFLVDDSAEFLSLLRLFIESLGYEVLTATNGQEAYNKLLNEPRKPTLIFLDVMMPEMDGFELLKRKKESPNIANIPVVMISAGAFDKEQIEKIHAVEYLKKPLDLDNLLHVIESHCGKKTSL